MKRTVMGLALAAAAFLAGTGAQAQFTIAKSVLASGGSAMANSEFAIVGTVGQPTIGVVSDANTTGNIGFWYVQRVTNAVEDPVVARSGGNALDQNFPNPFKEETTIRFNLVKHADVTLKVFNTAGQEIATLAAGEYESGQHEVVLQGNKIASGVYIYQLQVGSFVLQRQMLVVR